jgi:hypothetical protein
VLQRRATTPAVYLSPPCHTRPYPVTEHVAWDALTEFFHEERTFRGRFLLSKLAL